MPLLMCPNCQSDMKTLNRAGVEFDMCPTCRGVWLDRGELEKIMENARLGADQPNAPLAPQPPYPSPSRHYGAQYGERGEYGERGVGQHGKRKRGFDIFDIFD